MKNAGFQRYPGPEGPRFRNTQELPGRGGLEVSEVCPHSVLYVFAVALRCGSPERSENSQTGLGVNLLNLQTSEPKVFEKRVALGLRPATLASTFQAGPVRLGTTYRRDPDRVYRETFSHTPRGCHALHMGRNQANPTP
jgi:hypothetical protein